MVGTRIKRVLRITLIVLALAFLGLQLFPAGRTNPPVESDLTAPPEVMRVLRAACYDCHSHETQWPWYSYLNPVSWWVVDHVEHGRGDLNFSRWPAFSFDEQQLALQDIADQISRDKMPIKPYRFMHARGRLTDEQRQLLVEWAQAGP
jgi:hypothetical protein